MQTPPFRPAPCLDGAKVLIVDDEADVRESLDLFFNALGAEVKQAASAEEGLRQWAAWDPTVVLSDIGMPGLNGHQFVQILRTAEHLQGLRHTPVIAVSAYSDDRAIATSKSAGFDLHFAKPSDPIELAYISVHSKELLRAVSRQVKRTLILAGSPMCELLPSGRRYYGVTCHAASQMVQDLGGVTAIHNRKPRQ